MLNALGIVMIPTHPVQSGIIDVFSFSEEPIFTIVKWPQESSKQM